MYLTASINEPAGMHHIEGALCGLPIIYRESGALPEYCRDYGVAFQGNNYIPAIKKMIKNYKHYKEKVLNYPNDSTKMTNDYLKLFEELLSKREEIIHRRTLLNSPIMLLKFFIFSFKPKCSKIFTIKCK